MSQHVSHDVIEPLGFYGRREAVGDDDHSVRALQRRADRVHDSGLGRVVLDRYRSLASTEHLDLEWQQISAN